MAHDQCVIGDRGRDMCTRACPRFRDCESDLDQELFGRRRTADEPYGIARSILSTRTTDEAIARVGGLLTELSTASRTRWPSVALPDTATRPGLLPVV